MKFLDLDHSLSFDLPLPFDYFLSIRSVVSDITV